VHAFSGLPTTHSETGVCFSPDESLILTGTSAQRDGTGGALLFFDVTKYASAVPPLHRVCMLHLYKLPNRVSIKSPDQSSVRVLRLLFASNSLPAIVLLHSAAHLWRTCWRWCQCYTPQPQSVSSAWQPCHQACFCGPCMMLDRYRHMWPSP